MSSPHPPSPTRTIEDELDRRLAILTDPSYQDPARHDLQAVDFLLLALLNVAVVLIMLWYAWG